MRIARCQARGEDFWGLVVDNDGGQGATRIKGGLSDWAPRLIRGDVDAIEPEGPPIPLDELRLLPPVERGAKIVAIGANYGEHARELGMGQSGRPHAFLKAHGALIGANDPVVHPGITGQLDHEVELVVVMGDAVERPDGMMKAVLGYTIGNDVSARDLQLTSSNIGMDLFAAKSLDRTSGLGPWIATRDQFGDTMPDLRIMLSVNGITRQDGRTGDMTFPISDLIAHVDSISRLEAGDIIYTGTPLGVGWKEQRWLVPGDVVRCEIEGIGAMKQRVVSDFMMEDECGGSVLAIS